MISSSSLRSIFKKSQYIFLLKIAKNWMQLKLHWHCFCFKKQYSYPRSCPIQLYQYSYPIAVRGKKVQGILVKTCILTLWFCKTVSQISFNLFCSDEMRLIPRIWCSFSKNIGSGLKFWKTEIRFCRWNSNDYNDINIFLSLEIPWTFLLAKEKTWKHNFKTSCEFSQIHIEK